MNAIPEPDCATLNWLEEGTLAFLIHCDCTDGVPPALRDMYADLLSRAEAWEEYEARRAEAEMEEVEV